MCTTHDLAWLADLARKIYSARTYEELHGAVVGDLHRRFSSIVSVCESASHDGSQFASDRLVGSVAVPADYALYLWDHPNVIRLLTGPRLPVLHLREAVSVGAYQRTDYFNALCRPNALHDQILTVVWHERRLTSFGINRDRLFSASERFILTLLQPHLMAGLRRVGAHNDVRLLPFADPWIELSPAGWPWRLGARQLAVLRAYFPEWRPARERLPRGVVDWVEECRRLLHAGIEPVPLCAMWIDGLSGRLGLRYFPETLQRAAAIRLVESPVTVAEFIARGGMSLREREVLGWMAEGKRDREIAQILGISANTVSKHVEHVLAKLRAGSRTAAARFGPEPAGGERGRV